MVEFDASVEFVENGPRIAEASGEEGKEGAVGGLIKDGLRLGKELCSLNQTGAFAK